MKEIGRLMALGLVFCTASVAWLVLAGVMTARTSSQEDGLRGRVADLWGTPLEQAAPTSTFHWVEEFKHDEVVRDADGKAERDKNGQPLLHTVVDHVQRDANERLSSTALTVDLTLDQRRKGLMWFSLYDVTFDGTWTVAHAGDEAGTMYFDFTFPAADGMYDDFRVTVDGKEQAIAADTIILCAGQKPKRELTATHLIGGAKEAGELDAKRAMLEGAELAAKL